MTAMDATKRVLWSLLWLALMACVAGGGYALFRYVGNRKRVQVKREQDPIPVTVARASSATVYHTVREIGTLEPDETVEVRSETIGVVVEIKFEEGQRVRAGQVLVELEKPKLEAVIEELEARKAELEIERGNAARSLQRKKKLLDQGLLSEEVYDDAKSVRDAKTVAIKVVEAQVKLARENLRDATIRAPIDGVTGEREVGIGDLLRVGDEVVTIVDDDPIKVSFGIPDRYRTMIKLGEATLVASDNPPAVCPSKVYFIGPRISESTRSVPVKSVLEFPKDPAGAARDRKVFTPGSFVHVVMTTAVHPNALVLPEDAVIRTGPRAGHVFVVERGKALRREIEVLLDRRGTIEATGDVRSGDVVITRGKYRVEDGKGLRIIKSVSWTPYTGKPGAEVGAEVPAPDVRAAEAPPAGDDAEPAGGAGGTQEPAG
jgi:RND family efflux transporter MFP subunit